MPRKIPSWQRHRATLIHHEFEALARAIDHEGAALVAGLAAISGRIDGRPIDGGRSLKASTKTLTTWWYRWDRNGRTATALLPDYKSDGHANRMPDDLVFEIQRLATAETGGRDKNRKGMEPTAIYHHLVAKWRKGESLPGTGTWREWWSAKNPGLPLPPVPPDFPWCARTVIRHSGPEALKRMGNIGAAAALKHLPHIDRDYSLLRRCELYTLDDVRLDFVCIDEITGRVVTMIAYLLMEVSSRFIVAFLVKPEDSIKAEDVDELLARGLQTEGFGLGVGYQTHIWFERGTVACSEAAQLVLEAFSDGALKIHRTSMDGGVRWIGAAADRASGHSAGKAVIESFNRNLHRRTGFLPGQRGNNAANQPANLGVGDSVSKDPSRSDKQTIRAEAERLSQFKLTALAAGADARLKLPLLTVTQGQQAVAQAVRDHNHARGHSMQGFHTITEAEIAPGVWREIETL